VWNGGCCDRLFLEEFGTDWDIVFAEGTSSSSGGRAFLKKAFFVCV
jgi:hypothetical protein